jgi:tetratricopeptide (TPR) repeat protein
MDQYESTLTLMKNTIRIIFLFNFLSGSSFAQTAGQVREFFETKSYDYAIKYGKDVIDQKKDEYDTYLLVGRSYNAKYKFAEAIPYLERAKSLKQVPDWVTAWALCELGFSYYATGNKKLSSQNLNGCIKLNATKNSQKTALRYTWVFGFDPFYSNWTTEISENFNFYFQDSTFEPDAFIKLHEKAFDSLSTFFNCKLPHKIDFFVWAKDTDQLAKTMMRPLAFSKPEFTVVHASRSNSPAHEIMHHILYYAFPDSKNNELITEGTCVYFDLSGRNNLKKLKDDKSTSEIKVKEYWERGDKFKAEILYPLGGELVKRIFEKFGKEKFILFMADQSLENAYRVFGKELDEVINQLQTDIRKE